jgi:hypothetical protein
MVEDGEHSGLQDTRCSENVKKVDKIVNKNQQSAILEISGRIDFLC